MTKRTELYITRDSVFSVTTNGEKSKLRKPKRPKRAMIPGQPKRKQRRKKQK